MTSARSIGGRWLACVAVLAVAMRMVSGSTGPVTLLLSADTEGQIASCQVCSVQTAPGGMARRATLVAQRRKSAPSLLLVDAGNTFFGAGSIASGGSIIVAAYNGLGYDAVNLSYRDFRLGKARTLKMLADARFAVVSCNLLDGATGQLIAKPFVVRQAGNERVAIIGVTEPPGANDVLPHLAQQLAGVRVQRPLEALSAWLPKARREADLVVLLFYGSSTGLAAVDRAFSGDFAGILVGGIPCDVLPRRSRPPIVGATEQGRSIAEVRLLPDGRAEARQLDVVPSIENDAKMEALLKPYRK